MSSGAPAGVSNTISGHVTALSVSYQDATIDEIQAVAPESPVDAMRSLQAIDEVQESLVLATCNRVEWYVVASAADAGQAAITAVTPTSIPRDGRWMSHDEALEHLLRVGAGLESMVLGEDQILGQLRRACEDATRIDALGPLLDEAVWKAIHTGERIRTETAINEGVVSIGSAAVELAIQELTLDDRRAMVVGAGEMGRRVARALATTDIDELVIANRTLPHADHLADSVPCPARTVSLDEIESMLPSVSLVVTATASSDPILTTEQLPNDTPMVIDIAQPRDIEVSDPPPSAVYDLDDLRTITDETHEARRAAATEAAAIVAAEHANLQEQFKQKQADAVIAAMYESAEAIKRREVAQARAALSSGEELTDDQRAVLEDLADAMIGQLLAAPTKSLREAAAEDDWETIQTALSLFDPSFAASNVTLASPETTISTDDESAAER